MNITFDRELSKEVWDAISVNLKSRKCIFCGNEITSETFVGAAMINDSFAAFDGNIVCLVQLTNNFKENKDET